MAAPSQNIPLGQVNLKALVNDLSKERQKLEREIEKSLNAVGKADGELTRRLRDLNLKESQARTALSSQGSTQGTIRGLRAARGEYRDLTGAFNLLTGRGSFGDVRDFSDVLEAASERMAKAGYARSASLMGKASSALGTAALIGGRILGPVGLIYAGTETVLGVANTMYGNPDEMKSKAAKSNSIGRKLDQYKNVLTEEQYKEVLGLKEFSPEKAEAALKKALGTEGDREQYEKIRQERKALAKEKGETLDTLRSGIKWSAEGLAEEQAKEDNARFDAWKEQQEYDKQKQLSDWGRSQEGLRTRTLQNIRLIGLRKIEEQRWSGVKDWSV
jgi:hypothetical protein